MNRIVAIGLAALISLGALVVSSLDGIHGQSPMNRADQINSGSMGDCIDVLHSRLNRLRQDVGVMSGDALSEQVGHLEYDIRLLEKRIADLERRVEQLSK